MKSCLLFLFCLLTHEAMAQGCSDAGFCSIGNLSQHSNVQPLKKKLTFISPIGKGDEGVLVITPGIQYDVHVSRHWNLQAKVTTGYANGDMGSMFGLGDLVVSGVYNLPAKNGWVASAALGMKAPLNNGDLKGLPMQYQSSLGTFDLITGLSLGNQHWQFAGGWQQPLSGANGLSFKRKGDVLLRSAYLFQPLPSWSFNLGLLGIYHLGRDSYEKMMPIAGSEGLTLNITAGGWWKINDRFTVGITGGTPLIAREVRPDGLTRKFVIAPEISYNF